MVSDEVLRSVSIACQLCCRFAHFVETKYQDGHQSFVSRRFRFATDDCAQRSESTLI